MDLFLLIILRMRKIKKTQQTPKTDKVGDAHEATPPVSTKSVNAITLKKNYIKIIVIINKLIKSYYILLFFHKLSELHYYH